MIMILCLNEIIIFNPIIRDLPLKFFCSEADYTIKDFFLTFFRLNTNLCDMYSGQRLSQYNEEEFLFL